jgi:RNA polymerase sigma factor (sigma-70 family)
VSHGVAAELRERIDSLYRSESRRVLATLIRLLGDFDLAEEALQDAFMAAMQQWPRDGLPANPRSWLVSTGRFKAIDRLRRRARFDTMLGELAARLDGQEAPDPVEQDDQVLEDDRLRLIFTCCHPALPPDAQVAMTLREVCGLTTEEIARAFLAGPPTVAQRIVRAKAKIRAARTSADGDLILLPDQDRSCWDRERIAEGAALLGRATSSGRIGPYALQAAIAAAHAEAPTAEATDWHRIVGLYDLLAWADPSPVVELNRAVAVSMRDGPSSGLALVDAILARGQLDAYHLAHAARADLLRRMGRTADARASYRRALELTRQEPERRFIERRLNELAQGPGDDQGLRARQR